MISDNQLLQDISYRIPNFEKMLQKHNVPIEDQKYIEAFQSWLEKFYKLYDEEEAISRFLIFCKNYDLVEK